MSDGNGCGRGQAMEDACYTLSWADVESRMNGHEMWSMPGFTYYNLQYHELVICQAIMRKHYTKMLKDFNELGGFRALMGAETTPENIAELAKELELDLSSMA